MQFAAVAMQGSTARGLWVPAAPWGGRDLPAELLLQQEGTLNSLSCKAVTPHVWELSQWEEQKQTNKQTVRRRETEKRRCHSVQHQSHNEGWKTKELSPLGLFWACKISSSPSPRTFIFVPVLEGEGI